MLEFTKAKSKKQYLKENPEIKYQECINLLIKTGNLWKIKDIHPVYEYGDAFFEEYPNFIGKCFVDFDLYIMWNKDILKVFSLQCYYDKNKEKQYYIYIPIESKCIKINNEIETVKLNSIKFYNEDITKQCFEQYDNLVEEYYNNNKK